MNHALKQDLKIGQLVVFQKWADSEDHKDGPHCGEVGRVVDILVSLPEELFPTSYEVVYREGAPNERLIVHYRVEITPTSLEEIDESRRTVPIPIPVPIPTV